MLCVHTAFLPSTAELQVCSGLVLFEQKITWLFHHSHCCFSNQIENYWKSCSLLEKQNFYKQTNKHLADVSCDIIRPDILYIYYFSSCVIEINTTKININIYSFTIFPEQNMIHEQCLTLNVKCHLIRCALLCSLPTYKLAYKRSTNSTNKIWKALMKSKPWKLSFVQNIKMLHHLFGFYE